MSVVPLYESFRPAEYGAHNQNWSIDFDKIGRVYIANNDGVLIYDGVQWRILNNYSLGIIRSVVVTDEQTIYVGGQGSIGQYRSNENGVWQYQAVPIPVGLGDIAEVRKGLAHNGSVYFGTSKYLLKVDGQSIAKVASVESGYATLGRTGALSWAYVAGIGLIDLDGDITRPIISETQSHVIGVHQTPNGLLLVLKDGGLRYISNDQFYLKYPKVEEVSNSDIDSISIIGSQNIPGGIVILTLGNGAIIIDEQGETLHRIKEGSLNTLSANYDNGNLWIGFDGAMVRLPWPVLLEKYASDKVLDSKIQSIAEHQGQLFLGTNHGLHVISNGEVELVPLPSKTLVSGRPTAWDMVSTKAGLLVVTQHGTFVVNQDHITTLIDGHTRGLGVLGYPQDHFLITSFKSGLHLLKITEDEIEIVSHNSTIKPYTSNVVQMDDRSILLGTRKEGVYRVTINSDMSLSYDNLPVETLSEGRQGDSFTTVLSYQGKPRISAYEGVCIPEFAEPKSCKPDSLFNLDTRLSQYIGAHDDTLYFLTSSPSHNAIIKADSVEGIMRQHSNFSELPATRLNQVLATSSFVFLARRDGLWRYWPENLREASKPKAWIQSIESRGTPLYQAAKLLHHFPREIPVTDNSLRFSFASDTSSNVKYHQWRTKLVGYEDEYSDWSFENWKDYTQLSGGDYQLLVQLKLRSGLMSEEARLSFAVAYPWYATPLARFIVALVVLALVYVTAHFLSLKRTAILKQKQRELEDKVHARTIEIERQNEQLSHQAQKLTELDQSKSRFFANITHEFRTPLTLTIGPLHDALAGRYGELDGELKHALTLANQRSEDLLSLIEEMLDIARLDAGALPLYGQRVDILALCKHAISQLDSWALAKNIDFEQQFNSSHHSIIVDPKQLAKVLNNLLGNAIKFTPENGTVKFELYDDEQAITIKVSDTGPGISEQDVKQIFERFHQVGHNKNISLGGVGLGLSLAKEITEMHGGEIRVESELGEGTCFTLTLPKNNELIIDSSKLAETPSAFASVENNTIDTQEIVSNGAEHQHTLLIIEDDADLRHYIAEHFIDQYRVVTCSNGDAGIKHARKLIPDLIISDVMMPIMDGMELCQTLKSDPETDFIPIILLTARIDDSDRIDGFDVGADDYLAKPFSADVLKSRVINLIASRRKLLAHASDAHVIFPDAVGLVNRDQRFAEQFQTAMKEGLSNSEFSIEKLAVDLHMDRTTLYKKVHAMFDATPSELLIKARLNWACELLQIDQGNISEIAFTVGYNNVAHFSQSFKKHFAITPSQYRQKHSEMN